ncbi:MAG: TIGR02206 family membrane protein [Clostridia bacterium]|nr:TIGR02206 family membrane protein [Clostridia bacterium]
MENFFKHFFGQADPSGPYEFKNFSLAHFLPILVAAGVIYLIFRYRSKLRTFRHEDKLRMALSFTLIITEMSYFWRLVGVPSLNANPYEHLPITVCGWAIIFSSVLVLTKSQTLYDICYFWVFAGTIFALITPTVINFTGPTRFRYYQFWCEHLLGYVAVFYMTFVHKMRPNVKSIIKSYAMLLALGVIAIFANNLLDSYAPETYEHDAANYLFMAKGEAQSPILEILPENYVVRVIVMALVVGALFIVSYLPWFFIDRHAKKKQTEVDTVEAEKQEAPIAASK